MPSDLKVENRILQAQIQELSRQLEWNAKDHQVDSKKKLEEQRDLFYAKELEYLAKIESLQKAVAGIQFPVVRS